MLRKSDEILDVFGGQTPMSETESFQQTGSHIGSAVESNRQCVSVNDTSAITFGRTSAVASGLLKTSSFRHWRLTSENI